jgi:hypothetical protein
VFNSGGDYWLLGRLILPLAMQITPVMVARHYVPIFQLEVIGT